MSLKPLINRNITCHDAFGYNGSCCGLCQTLGQTLGQTHGKPVTNYWIVEVIKIATLFVSGYLLGLLALHKGVKVNYTRKIFHFLLFFLPVYLATLFPFDGVLITTFLSGFIYLLCISLMIKPIRDRSPFLATVFASFDRPEDRPLTLLWIFTQLLVTYAVLLGVLKWLGTYDKINLIAITVFVAAIGDGLAEPVGVRFGKHKYTVYALFTDKKYTRSIEGSLCVLVSGVVGVVLVHQQLTVIQLMLALLIIPVAMTLAEALSPHTWDGPLLYLVGGASTVAVLELSDIVIGV